MNDKLMDRLQSLTRKAKIMQETGFSPVEVKDSVDSICKMLGDNYPIAILEAVLKIYKDRLNNIVKKEMPEIMLELGVAELKLSTGEHLENKKIVSGKVKDREEAAKWLMGIGRDDLIKTTLKFGNGEVDDILLKKLAGYSYVRTDDVNYQSLNVIIRDQYKEGILPPPEAIEMSVFDEVKIK